MLSHVYMGLISVILVGYDSSFGNDHEQCHCPVTCHYTTTCGECDTGVQYQWVLTWKG